MPINHLHSKLNALSKEEILELITTVSEKHPEIIDYFIASAPKPSLTSTKDKINKLEREYEKAFPYNKYGSNRDAYAYKRVAGKLNEFKVPNSSIQYVNML